MEHCVFGYERMHRDKGMLRDKRKDWMPAAQRITNVGTMLESSHNEDACHLSEFSRPHDTPQHQLYAITTFVTMIGIPVPTLITTWCDPPRISNAHALPTTKGRPIPTTITNIRIGMKPVDLSEASDRNFLSTFL